MSKFIILDRDGVLNKDTGYTHKIEDLEILPGTVEGLVKFRDAGWKFIVVTNQAGIARKMYCLEDAEKFNRELSDWLANYGIKIEKIYLCSHHPDITGPCSCRKPNTGLVKLAASEFGFNPADCVYIGDKDSDIKLGQNCGGTTVLIENNQYQNQILPDFKAKNLDHAFEIIMKTAQL